MNSQAVFFETWPEPRVHFSASGQVWARQVSRVSLGHSAAPLGTGQVLITLERGGVQQGDGSLRLTALSLSWSGFTRPEGKSCSSSSSPQHHG